MEYDQTDNDQQLNRLADEERAALDMHVENKEKTLLQAQCNATFQYFEQKFDDERAALIETFNTERNALRAQRPSQADEDSPQFLEKLSNCLEETTPTREELDDTAAQLADLIAKLEAEKDETLLQTGCSAAFNYFSQKYDTRINGMQAHRKLILEIRDQDDPLSGVRMVCYQGSGWSANTG